MAAFAAPDDLRNVSDGERAASAVAGAALVLYAMARPSFIGTLAALGGVMLLERGITGQCQIYRALGLSTQGGTTHGEGKRGARSIRDEIDDAAADSFPASDPPAWTPHRAGHPAAVS